MAQKRFGIVLNNGKAISGAGVFVLAVTFVVFFPCAVGVLVGAAMRRIPLEAVGTALAWLVGPALITFGLGLLVLRLLRVPFLRPAHEVEGPNDAGAMGPIEKAVLGAALQAGEVREGGVEQAGRGKLWWVWRAFAGVMAVGLVVAGIRGLIQGNEKAVMLLAVGVAAGVVAVTGRDVVGG